MRVFKVKNFARFQRREGIADAALCKAIDDAIKGLIDADLGHGLIKQRVARPGKGKSGGYRTIIAFRVKRRAVFLFGFAKSRMANVDDDDLRDLTRIGGQWLAASDAKIEDEIIAERLMEVHCDEEENGQA